MNFLLHPNHAAAFERIATAASVALVAGLWQGIALAVLTGVVLKFLPRTTAAARFLLWSAVFAASAGMPLVHLAASNQHDKAINGPLLLDSRWSYLLAAVWLAAATYRLALLAVEAAGLRQLWRGAEPVPEQRLERAGLQGTLSNCRVEVCSTSEVDRPSIIGFFAPRILIPIWLLSELSDTELRHIVLHEMEHLRRRDDWLNLLQKIGLALFPLNPAMFWIDRRLSTEREIACDDGVLARTNAPRAYASSLTSIAERRLGLKTSGRMVALALSAFGAGAVLRRRSEFATRIESILGRRPSSSPALGIILAVVVLAGAVAMTHAPDLVTFGKGGALQETAHAIPVPVASGATTYSAPATFENVKFPVSSRHRVMSASRPAKASPQPAATFTRAALPQRQPSHNHQQQWLVLTSFEQPMTHSSTEDAVTNHREPGDLPEPGDVVVPMSRVIIRTPDGQFFVAPYAAVPTQAGWLFVQL